MDAHLTCPRGHCWPMPDAGAPGEGMSALVCPVCGPIVESRLTAATRAAVPVGAAAVVREQATVRLHSFKPFAPKAPPQVAGYEILGEIGRGGMGVVYQARQKTLNRIVALKMILDACRDQPQEHARFLSEAEVIASLHHPNIVQIYEIGEADGRPYFSLEYVEGGSLAQRLRNGVPLLPQQAARLIADLARAVDAAHRQGVVHRDLKPANILLAGGPDLPIGQTTPKITDFGLAKKRDGGLKTTTGFILGTPCYMAPEQAAGKVDEVGPASDIYSLGAILYELLTGRPPFQGDTALVTMQQVISEDPVAPTHLQPQAPVDLEIICLKCLQKEPRKRYAAASALADDLQCYLDGRPILARPITPGERLVKWTRRRPAAATFLGISLAAFALLLAGGVWHTLQLHDALAGAESARDASVRAKNLAEDRERQVREYQYAAHVRQAGQFWDHTDLRQMRDLLALDAGPGNPDPREFTWRYLSGLSRKGRQTLKGHSDDVYFVVYSPDGTKLATASKDHTLRLWDAAAGRERAVLHGHKEEVNSAAFSPDGAVLASADDGGRILLWDVETGRERGCLQESGATVTTVAWASSGRVATGGQDKTVHLWDVDSRQELLHLEGNAEAVESLAFAPGGRFLASGAHDGALLVWDLDGGGKPHALVAGKGAIQTVTWSRDGRRLAAACEDGLVRLWDADSWQPRQPLRAHVGEAHGVAFSPDGKVLATGGTDHLVRLWDVETGAPRNVLKGHEDRIWSVAFSPDGTTIASASRDHTVKLWDPEPKQDWTALPAEGSAVSAAVLSKGGQTLALGRADGSVQLRGIRENDPLELLPRQAQAAVVALTFAPDDRRLAVQDVDGTVILWDLDQRRPKRLRQGAYVGRGALSFSADGRTLGSVSADGQAFFWDSATGEPLPAPLDKTEHWTCLAFSAVGGLLAAAKEKEDQVVLYDTRTGKVLRTLLGHRARVTCLVFSADGKTLATAGLDQTTKLWDVESGREKSGALLGHGDAVASVALHPGGKTVATGSADRTVRLWDAVTGQELARLPVHAGRVSAVAFTPDGNTLISAADGPAPEEVRLWSAEEAGEHKCP